MSGDIFRRSIILSERMSSAISTMVDAGRDTALVCIMLLPSGCTKIVNDKNGDDGIFKV